MSVFYMQIRNTMVESVGGGWPAAREGGRAKEAKKGRWKRRGGEVSLRQRKNFKRPMRDLYCIGYKTG